MTEVRGMGEALKQAEAGLKLFEADDAIVPDVAAATKFKEEVDAKIAILDAEAAALTGKENKKLRVEKEKEKSGLKNQHDYIDACKIVKGNPPVHGYFVISGGGKAVSKTASQLPVEVEAEKPTADEAKGKSKKAQESAGISRAERDELESLKKKIIDKKAELKEQGMSGGQINKNEEIVSWVARMNELKEKETPGSTQGKDDKKGGKKKKLLDSQSAQLLAEKQQELDAYADKLRTEFKYSKKEIAADPDYQEMKAALEKIGWAWMLFDRFRFVGRVIRFSSDLWAELVLSLPMVEFAGVSVYSRLGQHSQASAKATF